MSLKLVDAIEDFQEHCRLVKSEQTVKYQMFQFRAMLNYFHSHGIEYISQIKKTQLDSMLIFFKDTCKNITLNKRVLLLRMLYKHLEIPFDYLMDFPKLRQEQNRYNSFSEKELSKIINYAYSLDEMDPFQLTRKLVILLLLDSGVRQSELLNIQINNISFEENMILLTSTAYTD